MVPYSGFASPRIMRKMVDFPYPLRPTSPKRSPEDILREAFSNSTCGPNDFVKSKMESIVLYYFPLYPLRSLAQDARLAGSKPCGLPRNFGSRACPGVHTVDPATR